MHKRIGAVVMLLTLAGVAQQSQPAQQLTIEKIFAGAGPTGPMPGSLQWSPDGSKVAYVLRDDNGEHAQLWYVEPATGKPAVLVSEERLDAMLQPNSKLKNEREKEARNRYGVQAFHWAPDSKHILFDSLGQLWYYSLDTQTGVPVTSSPEPVDDPKFSPDGSWVSYIRNHNLFVQPISGKQERALTKEKDPNLRDGEVDWVYEEELDVRSNYFWEPNGKQLVLLQMNETPVPSYPIEDFIPQHATIDEQRYPQAGDPNPAVRLGVVESKGGKVKWLELPEQKMSLDKSNVLHIGGEGDIYIPRFGWVRNGVLYAEVLNRAQNEIKLYFIDAKSGRSQLMLDEKDDKWIDVNNAFRVIAPNRFLWQSWRDGDSHLYVYSFDAKDPLNSAATLERQLTRGPWQVEEVSAVVGNTVFFECNKEDARQRQLYSVNLDGTGITRVTQSAGVNFAEFPENANPGAGAPYFVNMSTALTSPPEFAVCRAGGACQTFWRPKDLTAYNLIKPQFVDFKADDGSVLHGIILLPTNATAEHSVPLLNNPYGGPDVQTVMDAWGSSSLFDQILAREGIAVLHVDNRGMAGRSKKFQTAIFRNFGETELKDQLTSIDQALEKFPQLDPKRLAWWGWSYGGTMTLYALTHSDRFLGGVAVAPVTDWHNYDSIYTERYMGLPQENEAAYKRCSDVTSAANLHGDVLIVHGTGDDNVHMQNTIQMIQALISGKKRFQLMLYPRKTHSIAGAEDRDDLFHRINIQMEKLLLGKAAEE